ncbi:MAG: hypothetical protein WCJ29_01905 [bacterium]
MADAEGFSVKTLLLVLSLMVISTPVLAQSEPSAPMAPFPPPAPAAPVAPGTRPAKPKTTTVVLVDWVKVNAVLGFIVNSSARGFAKGWHTPLPKNSPQTSGSRTTVHRYGVPGAMVTETCRDCR